ISTRFAPRSTNRGVIQQPSTKRSCARASSVTNRSQRSCSTNASRTIPSSGKTSMRIWGAPPSSGNSSSSDPKSKLDEFPDEGGAPHMRIDVFPELGIVRDAFVEQERCDRFVTEEARAHERFVDGCWITPLFVERGANRVEIAKRRIEFQRARQQAFAMKQLQQS